MVQRSNNRNKQAPLGIYVCGCNSIPPTEAYGVLIVWNECRAIEQETAGARCGRELDLWLFVIGRTDPTVPIINHSIVQTKTKLAVAGQRCVYVKSASRSSSESSPEGCTLATTSAMLNSGNR